MRTLARQHPLVLFVTIAYAFSWAFWMPLALGGATVSPGGTVTHFPGLLGPAVAAFLVTALAEGKEGLVRLLRRMAMVSQPYGEFLLYTLSPLLLLALALIASAVGPGIPPVRDFTRYSGLPPLPLPLVFLLVLLFNGYGEETGWRGFALAPLQRRFGPLKGTLILGLVWAGWHIPAFWFVEGYRSLGPGMLLGGFGLGILSGSLILARVANRTGGSILAVSLWHGIYNMASATAASRGIIGAVTTACVMVWATTLLIREWRRGDRPSAILVPTG